MRVVDGSDTSWLEVLTCVCSHPKHEEDCDLCGCTIFEVDDGREFYGAGYFGHPFHCSCLRCQVQRSRG